MKSMDPFGSSGWSSNDMFEAYRDDARRSGKVSKAVVGRVKLICDYRAERSERVVAIRNTVR